MHTREEKVAAFGRLLDIMDTLREQCPWNAAQTFESIRPLSEEEVYELSDTILKGDRKGTAKELGDLLYHIVFYARIGQEEGTFDIADCIDKVCDKMVFRHPHVFGPDAGKPTTAKEIADTWELVKAKEKDGNKRVMAGIPDAMPAILKAMSLQEKARGCGFDWEQKEDVWPKVREEMGEAKRRTPAQRMIPPTCRRSSATSFSPSSTHPACTASTRKPPSTAPAPSSAAASTIWKRRRSSAA